MDRWMSVKDNSAFVGEWVYKQDVYLQTRMAIFVTGVGAVQIRRWEHKPGEYTYWTTLQICNSLDEAKQVYMVMAKMEEVT